MTHDDQGKDSTGADGVKMLAGTELKPCPFCGGEAHIYTTSQDSDTQVQAQCKSCGAEIAFWLPWTSGAGQIASAWNDVTARWNTRTDLTTAKLAQALARAEAAEAALEAEMPWTIQTPNLEEYGHAVARAALEKAADECALWADRIAIRAIANNPAALAEIVKGSQK